MTKQKTEPTFDPLVRKRDAARQFGVSRKTLWEWERTGRIPPAIRMTARTVGWRQSTLDSMMTLAQRLVVKHSREA